MNPGQQPVDPVIAQALSQSEPAPVDPVDTPVQPDQPAQPDFTQNNTIKTTDASVIGGISQETPPPEPTPEPQPEPPAQHLNIEPPVEPAPQFTPAPAPEPQPAQTPPPAPAPVEPPPSVGSAQKAPADTPPKNPNSTQNTLMFDELRDNMIIMGDASFRAVIAAQSVNFDLMSEREREGIEFSYQNFLNSLNFPIQIYIRSQRVDLESYLEKLENIRAGQDNMLLGVLMDDYIQFIDMLSREANIMDKSFFIVIPYYSGDEHSQIGATSANTTKNLLSNLFMPSNYHKKQKIPADIYSHARDELNRRASETVDTLSQVGINAVRLKTKELGELLYNVYNPDTATREPIGDFRNFVNTITRRGDGPNPNQPTGGQ